MNIYLAIFFVLLVFANLEYCINKKSPIFLVVSSFILALIAGLRANTIGPDTYRYYLDFINKQFGQKNNLQFDIGYNFLTNVFVKIGLNVNQFFLFIAFLTIFLLALFFENNSVLPIFSLAYYYSRFFLARDMNQIRQSLAAAICLYALKYLKDKKLLKFSIVIIAASSIHLSSFLMFIPYFFINFWGLKHKDDLKKGFIYLYLHALVLSFFISPLLNFLFRIFNLGSNYLSYSAFVSGLGLLNPILILQTIISIILIYLINNYSISDLHQVFFKTYMVATLILLLFNQYHVLAGRSSTLLITVEPIVVTDIICILISRPMKVIFLNIYVICVFFLISNGLLNYLYVPYKTFF